MGTVELKTTLAQISSPPWAVDPDTREGMEWNIHIIDYDFNRVCFSSNPGGNSVKTTEANARLIAMAPDLAAEVLRLRSEVERLTEALTPSRDTKAAYMGEIHCDCPTENWKHFVPWTSIKEIMAMIRARAALKTKGTE